MHLQENSFLGLDLGFNSTQNVAQYPLHHETYAPAKFEVATAKGLGGDTITRNMADRHTQADRHTKTDGPTLVRN